MTIPRRSELVTERNELVDLKRACQHHIASLGRDAYPPEPTKAAAKDLTIQSETLGGILDEVEALIARYETALENLKTVQQEEEQTQDKSW